jgi:hypothetical protein
MKTLLLFICFIAAHVAECFVLQAQTNRFALGPFHPAETFSSSRLYMSDDDKQTTIKENVVSSDTSSMSSENETQYPLDIPSPILLATSMLLAISSVGTFLSLPERDKR